MKFDMRFKNIKNRHGKRVGRVQVESIGLQVGLTRIFHMIFFFFFKKTTCICHLENHATNYLM